MRRHTPAEQIARFDRKGNDSSAWRRRARELLVSSRALKRLWSKAIQHDPPHPCWALDYLDPYVMLLAMGFECLLKAKALEHGLKLAENGRYLPIPGVRHHDLLALAQRASFEVSEREAKVLRLLARRITAGRYPIQRSWGDQYRIRPDGLLEFLSVGWHPSWDLHCRAMRRRLAPNLFVRP